MGTVKTLFLDRDGTIIYDKDYLADPAGVELIPGARAALHEAQSRGYRLFLFTNQSGIGRGYYTLADVHACNRRMLELLDLGPELFTEICIAPEAHSEPEDSPRANQVFRKPSPRFILEMIAKYALAPEQCWMVGDRESDIEAGLRAGIHSVAVATGKYNLDEWRARLPAPATLHADLLGFVNSLAAHHTRDR
ncbi:hypothetical protein AXK11_03410 [Cephaloticoccus primus]|uniref:D,D-heptose 1,7-bisphosphate phosphatase n=1 Tax=Cephaloticoccus primus TaxID=1548207 RepID=A0A139SQV1_9BACT|nr:hypothetical protein AXK11_03410 [Cephaloticoccus primus]